MSTQSTGTEVGNTSNEEEKGTKKQTQVATVDPFLSPKVAAAQIGFPVAALVVGLFGVTAAIGGLTALIYNYSEHLTKAYTLTLGGLFGLLAFYSGYLLVNKGYYLRVICFFCIFTIFPTLWILIAGAFTTPNFTDSVSRGDMYAGIDFSAIAGFVGSFLGYAVLLLFLGVVTAFVIKPDIWKSWKPSKK